MFTITQTFCLGFVVATLAAQAPERKVSHQVLSSRSLPAADLIFDDRFKYAGAQRFELYGVADAEQHFFVDANDAGEVRRLCWIQFEHYLPSNVHRYDYKMTTTTEIGGLRFLYDTRLYTDYSALRPDPDSDGDRGRRLLQAKGFKLPKAALRVRLIHLPNADNRSELMIIYLDAIDPSGLPPNAVNEMTPESGVASILLDHLGHALKIKRP